MVAAGAHPALRQAGCGLAGPHLDTPELLYGGAVGGGKSALLLMAASLFADSPYSQAVILRKNYPDLNASGGLMDEARAWWPDYWNGKDHRVNFPTGARITFAHLSNATAHFGHQGAQYTFIGIDEAAQIPEYQLRYMNSRLRAPKESPVPLQVRYTANPDPSQPGHRYLRDYFVRSKDPRYVYFPASLDDNPHLDEGYAERLGESLTRDSLAWLRGGDWEHLPSGYTFEREWITDNIVDKMDWTPVRQVRSWDLAATQQSKSANDPDYSVGILLGVSESKEFGILDVERFRGSPAETERRMQSTAERDGPETPIVIEREPGSSGKIAMRYLQENVLAGFSSHGHNPTGDKKRRADPLSGLFERGMVKILNRHWTDELVSELLSFPEGQHDDQVDALSQAHWTLSRYRVAKAH